MDTALIAIMIGIVLGVAGSILLKKTFGRRVPVEEKKQHQIYAFVENMKSVGAGHSTQIIAKILEKLAK